MRALLKLWLRIIWMSATDVYLAVALFVWMSAIEVYLAVALFVTRSIFNIQTFILGVALEFTSRIAIALGLVDKDYVMVAASLVPKAVKFFFKIPIKLIKLNLALPVKSVKVTIMVVGKGVNKGINGVRSVSRKVRGIPGNEKCMKVVHDVKKCQAKGAKVSGDPKPVVARAIRTIRIQE